MSCHTEAIQLCGDTRSYADKKLIDIISTGGGNNTPAGTLSTNHRTGMFPDGARTVSSNPVSYLASDVRADGRLDSAVGGTVYLRTVSFSLQSRCPLNDEVACNIRDRWG